MIRKPAFILLAGMLLLSACAQNQAAGEDKASNAVKAVPNADHDQMTTAEQRAYTAPIGQQINWNNPNTGDSGSVTTIKDGYSQQGAYCREFQKLITTGGQEKKSFTHACQQPDGSWKVMPSQ